MLKVITNGVFSNDEVKKYFKDNKIVIESQYARMSYDLGNQEDSQNFENKYNKGNFSFDNFLSIYENEEDLNEEVEQNTYIVDVFFDINNIFFDDLKEFVDFVQSI